MAAIGSALFASAVEAQTSVTIFNNQVGIEVDQFADYPCSDAVGHALRALAGFSEFIGDHFSAWGDSLTDSGRLDSRGD